MTTKNKTHHLTAIMFTNIVGYTTLMQKNEATVAWVRTRHRQVFEETHQKYQGEILQYSGDGTLSVFQRAVEAVKCAIAIQKKLNSTEPVPLRIGLHLGDIVFDGTEIYGDGVNLAARIEHIGISGAILISSQINRELKSHPYLQTTSLGLFEFTNVSEPLEVFAVCVADIKVPQRSELKTPSQQETKSVAVLPFVNMSDDQNNEYFSDGMTEEIINALAKIKNLKVTSRTSSFYFKNKNIPIPQIAKALNVNIILEGSVRLAGNKMRITAQLINVKEDIHFWSETFDRSLDDIFAVQDEISLLIAERLREQVGHFDIDAHLVEDQHIPANTYKLYLKSRHHILKMHKPDIELAILILENIIQEYPKFTLAYLGMHLGYAMMGTLGFMPSQDAFIKGKPFLDKAIEINPDLPECQLNLSWTSFLQEWDFEKTYAHLNKALEEQQLVECYQSMTSVLVAEEKFVAAHHYIDIALQIDPFSDINYHLKAFVYYSSGKFEEAIQYYDKSVQVASNYTLSALEWGQTLICLNRANEALKLFQKLPKDQVDAILKLGGTTLAYAALGQLSEAEAGIKALEKTLETEMTERALKILILCYTLLNHQDKAMELIEKSIQSRLPLMIYLPTEPLLKPLHSKPKFQQLMQMILAKKSIQESPIKKYKQNLLGYDELQEYKRQIEKLMKEQRPYLDPNLTLPALADVLCIPANHLSRVLNEGFDQNFAAFVNTYRLETFKSKVADPSQQHLTILALAYDSGFNSKTVFNTFFKKTMGKTPKAYWKEVINN